MPSENWALFTLLVESVVGVRCDGSSCLSTRHTEGEGASVEELPPSDWFVGHFSLITDVGTVTPEQMALNMKKEVAPLTPTNCGSQGSRPSHYQKQRSGKQVLHLPSTAQ